MSLNLPEQLVSRIGDTYRLEFRTPLAVEGWNAQISLLAGIAAADIMLKGKVGLLRTLPSPLPDVLDRLRRVAAALGVPWAEGVSLRGVRAHDRRRHDGWRRRWLHQPAQITLRGAGYVAFDGTVPAAHEHGALATPYAHVTAPLRRLGDRFANAVVLALVAGEAVPPWALAALGDLPKLMGQANGREHSLSAAVVDFVETMSLRHRVGEQFDAAIVDVDQRGAMAQLRDPAVLARVPGAPANDLGRDVEVRLDGSTSSTVRCSSH